MALGFRGLKTWNVLYHANQYLHELRNIHERLADLFMEQLVEDSKPNIISIITCYKEVQLLI